MADTILTEQQIWDILTGYGLTDVAASGVMGNIQDESGFIPFRVQGDFSSGYTYSIAYTEDVNDGTISRYDFCNNGPNGGGYGYCQWTWYTRKENLYDYWQSSAYNSIGNAYMQLAFLWQDLQTNYSALLTDLQAESSPYQAALTFGNGYEKTLTPGEQASRGANAERIYQTYHGGPTPPPPPPPPPPGRRKSGLVKKYIKYGIWF